MGRPRLASVLLALVGWLAATAPAHALPVFAHRYGLTCQACHTTVPHLNVFGVAFQERGYRLPLPQRGAFPVAVKVNLAYSSDAQAGLPKAIVDEVELLTGGTIGRRFTYFAEQYVVDGGTAGNTRDLWLQYNAGAAHLRAGQFTLPLPVDPETERDTEAHYLVYDQIVGENPFNFFDARAGIEASGRTPGGFSAHAAAFSGGVMAYASQRVRSGLSIGSYRYQAPFFFRQGYALGESIGKFDATLVLQTGRDRQLWGNAASSGGFLELHYAFSPRLMAVTRFDRAGDTLSGNQHQTVLTLVMRPARNMRFTLEDQITDHHALNAGWLFAY